MGDFSYLLSAASNDQPILPMNATAILHPFLWDLFYLI